MLPVERVAESMFEVCFRYEANAFVDAAPGDVSIVLLLYSFVHRDVVAE